jgi:hypothetical protein
MLVDLVPVDDGAAVFAVPMVIGGLVGAGYTFMHQGDWASGGLFVGFGTFQIFANLANWIDTLAPGSAIVFIEFLIKAFGFFLALYTGLGGFIGGFIAWAAMDIYAHSASHNN